MSEPLTLQEGLELGFECMKILRAPQVFLWVAANGWQGGFEVVAAAHEHPNIAVSAKWWPTLELRPPGASAS